MKVNWNFQSGWDKLKLSGTLTFPPGVPLYPTQDSTWDPALSYPGFHQGSRSILPGIPPGILLYPTWDSTWDPALSNPEIPPGIPLYPIQNPTWDPAPSYPGFHLGSCSILPGILLYPTRDPTSRSILPGIPDINFFHMGKSPSVLLQEITLLRI